MDQMNNGAPGSRTIIRISRKRLIITTVVLLVLIGLAFLAQEILSSTFRLSNSAPVSSYPQVNYPTRVSESSQGSIMMPYPGYYNQQGDITDTREFMKTSYSAYIKTRDVQKVVTDVKNIVKGADGRIDNISSSEKYGSVSFVVAKSKFDAFRDEIAAIGSAKLYTENVSSQNLLGTKQNIEQQTEAVETALDRLNAQKKSSDKRHTDMLASLNRELSTLQVQLAAIRNNLANYSTTTDVTVVSGWRTQEQNNLSMQASIRQNIGAENSGYAKEKQGIDAQIANENTNLASVKKQDVQFGNNIETVSGSVSVSWVSMWQLAQIYSPISPIWIIIILAMLLWMFLNHLKWTPKIIIE